MRSALRVRTAIAAVVAGVLTLAFAPAATAADPPGSSGSHAPRYYVALGDSLAFGWQPTATDPTNRPATGYGDFVYSALRQDLPNLQHIKLACPGESTVTMVFGGSACGYDQDASVVAGAGDFPTQLSAAVQFLKAHAKFVDLVTIDIGAIDIETCVNRATGSVDLACIARAMGNIGQNLQTIIDRLQKAAPGVRIVGMNYYDPFLAAWLAPGGYGLAQSSLSLTSTFNGLLESVYGTHQVAVADVESAFQTYNPNPLPPQGTTPLPTSVSLVCAWTWMCKWGNIHANDAGAQRIAMAFLAELP